MTLNLHFKGFKEIWVLDLYWHIKHCDLPASKIDALEIGGVLFSLYKGHKYIPSLC